MRKSFVFLCICLGLLGFNSCGDDDPIIIEGNYGSTLEVGKDYKVSTFTLPHKGRLLESGVKELIIVLRSLDKNGVADIELESQVTVGKDILVFSMKIPRTLELEDGNYKLWLKLLNNTRLSRSFKVRFEKEMLHLVSSQAYDYSFSKTVEDSENGSATKPYKINNQGDFNTLLLALMSDSTSAKGLHFQQTADIIAPNVSTVVDGMQYYGEAFAGIYDGGGYKIEYVYSGQNDSEKASNVGLFTLLKDSAKIQNLVLDAKVTGGYSKVGGLAGEATGNITLKGIEVKGMIEASNEYVGGLIGYMKNGELKLDSCVLDMSVSAGVRFAGGLAGGADGTVLKINNLKTKNIDNSSNPTAFCVFAGSYAGGLVGTMGNTSFNLENVNLKHTVDGETSEVKVVTSEGAGVGGLFGQSVRQNADCSLKNVNIQCPVRIVDSGKYCGGLIGYLKLNKNLTIQRCESTSIVSGDEAVGGMIGEVNMEEGASISLDGLIKNHVCVKDAVSSVKGRETVGGFIGAFKSGSLTIKNIEIATSVSCTENNVGGLIGYLTNAKVNVEASTTLDENMVVEGPESVGGLFGYANNSTLKGISGNDVVYNNSIPKMSSFKDQYSGKVRGSKYVGGILGTLKGSSTDLLFFSADCSVSAVDGSQAESIGGIVGYFVGSNGNIRECVFKGKLNSGGGQYAGGIIGLFDSSASVSNAGTIQDCINWGEITGGNATGGIIGRMQTSSSDHVNYCVNVYRPNQGSIKGNENVGGIIGWVDNNSYFYVKGCANYATISATGSSGVGGIVGRLYGPHANVTNSVNHGEIKGTGEYMAGVVAKYGKDEHGLGLQNAFNGEVSACCNKGAITGSATHIGGIVGYLEEGYPDGASDKPSTTGAVYDCYNSGSISASNAGGIVGFAEAKSNVYRNLNSGKIADGKGSGIIADGDFGLFQNNPQCYGNYYIDGSAKNGGETGSSMSYGDADDTSKFHSKWDFSEVWQINSGGLPTLRNCSFQNVSYTPDSE